MRRRLQNAALVGLVGMLIGAVFSLLGEHAPPDPGRIAAYLLVGLTAGALSGLSVIAAGFVTATGIGCSVLYGLACMVSFEPAVHVEGLFRAVGLTLLGITGALVGLRAEAHRSPSLLASADLRDRIARCATALAGGGALAASFGEETVSALVLAGCVAVLVTLIALEARLLKRLSGWLAAMEQRGAEEVPDAATIDIGVGDELRQLGSANVHPYRGSTASENQPRPVQLLVGDPQAALRRMQARITARLLFAIAIATALGATLAPTTKTEAARSQSHVVVHLPPARLSWHQPQKPLLFDANGDGVEDVIGLHRLGFGGPNVKDDSLYLAATSGETFELLWTTRPFEVEPRDIFLAAGRVFLIPRNGPVMIVGPTNGLQIQTAPLPDVYGACVVDDGLLLQISRSPRYSEAAAGARVLPSGEIRFEKVGEGCPSTDFCRPNDDRSCTPIPPLDALTAARFGPAPFLRRHRADAIALGSGLPGSGLDESDRDFLFGFDPETYAVRWKERIDVAGPSAGATPTYHDVSNGRVLSYVPGEKGVPSVVARDAKTGAHLWTHAIIDGGRQFHTFSGSRTRVYVAVGDRIDVLDAQTGTQLGTIR